MISNFVPLKKQKMMKKIITFLLLVIICSNSFADGLTATLKHGDDIKAYYGVDALKNAYSAAVDNDVVTLSPGLFNAPETIGKSIALIGSGAFNSPCTYLTTTQITANNVNIQGVYFSDQLTLGAISSCYIKCCNINYLYGSTAGNHINTVVDECVIHNAYCTSKSVNLAFKNCTIDRFDSNSSSNIIYVTNCMIYYAYTSSDDSMPYGIYKNNIIVWGGNRFYYIAIPSPSEFYFNCFINTCRSSNSITLSGTNNGNSYQYKTYSDFVFSYPAQPLKYGNGQDGTPLGIYGGSGFSPYPSIPRIVSKTIDPNTDKDGKINVSITVKAEK